MSFYLRDKVDFKAHNEEVRSLMDAFNYGKPYRVPVIVYGSITNYFLNPVLNTNGWSFKDFFESPEIQVKAQLEYQKWQRFNLYCDREMGLPEDGWTLFVDFQNSYDAGWFGCPIVYKDGYVPDTIPILQDNKELLYELPETLDVDNGLAIRAIEFFEYMLDFCKNAEYEKRPVIPPSRMPGEGTDGPFDLAYKLRGAENLLIDMLTDEKYYHDLMSYITENLISRMKKMRQLRWSKFPDSPEKGVYKNTGFSFADDAIALISFDQYKEFVYPYHRRIFDEFSDGSDCYMHLCGNVERHLKFLKDEFNITCFDTGFPVDHGKLRKLLGPDVRINGGPTVMLLKDGSKEEIENEVRRICSSGVMEGGKFVMIAANNMAPCTPVENVKTMYEAAKKYGKY